MNIIWIDFYADVCDIIEMHGDSKRATTTTKIHINKEKKNCSSNEQHGKNELSILSLELNNLRDDDDVVVDDGEMYTTSTSSRHIILFYGKNYACMHENVFACRMAVVLRERCGRWKIKRSHAAIIEY